LADLVVELEAEAQRRFVRWDPHLWRALLAGPARSLAEALRSVRAPEVQAQRVLETYLRLASEGIGLGYLFPSQVGENVFTLAFMNLIPRTLAALPPDRQLQTLADCWNLGENLEHAPPWLRRIFLRVLQREEGLRDLEGLVARVATEAVGVPVRRLGSHPRVAWVDLGAEERSFLPGALHFVAPTVLCVHDRLAGGEDPVSLGVWLAEDPLILGPMGCPEPAGPTSDRVDLMEELATRDARVNDPLNCSANEWRAGVTLETSQFLVALLPS
jgi:hypothetical protein